jgi:hypothetical protein
MRRAQRDTRKNGFLLRDLIGAQPAGPACKRAKAPTSRLHASALSTPKDPQALGHRRTPGSDDE